MSSAENMKSRKVRRKRHCDLVDDKQIVKHKKKVLPKSKISERITNSNSCWDGLFTDGSSSKIYIHYKITFLVNCQIPIVL